MAYILMVFFIPYLEIIFSISTTKCDEPMAIAINLLFSAGLSAILCLILFLIKNKKAKTITCGVMLGLIPVIYYAEFLVYKNFKVFYDVNTCLNGAGGALSEFQADIRRLIFCADGLSRLALFFLPLIVFIAVNMILNKKNEVEDIEGAVQAEETETVEENEVAEETPKEDNEVAEKVEQAEENEAAEETVQTEKNKLDKKWVICVAGIACLAIVLFLIARALVASNIAYKNMYAEEYNYQYVVEKMGLSTGLSRDITNICLGRNTDVEFRFDSEPDSSLDLQNPEMIDTDSQEDIGVAEAATDGASSETNDGAESDNSEETECETESAADQEPIDYGVNALDIDFMALAATTSGTNAKLDEYVASLTPSNKNKYTGLFKGKNLIFLTAEAFSGYAVDPEFTPTLYKLIHEGIYCEDFYQPAVAGTTGGEYNNLFGLIPSQGGKSMSIITDGTPFITMGYQLNSLGYFGKAYHNNTNTVYSRNITHNRLGYSEGFMGVGDGMEEYLTGRGFPASDLDMMIGTIPEYINHQPFNIYYMTVSGHGMYGNGKNQMSTKNWDKVVDLDYSDEVKAYMANTLELEFALTYLVDELTKAGIVNDTVICMSPDHFPYNLDYGASLGNMPKLSELYGFDVNTYLDRDRNSCIIWSGCMEEMEPIVISAPTFSLDLLPTLSNLFGLDYDSRLYPGRDILSDTEAIIFDGGYDWKTELGTYTASNNKFTPVSEDIEIPEGYEERIRVIVKNKYSFCKGILADDYYGHVYSAICGETQ